MNPWFAPLRRDLPARLAAAALAVVSVLYLLPSPTLWSHLTHAIAPALFQLLVLFALESDRDQVEEASERRFWRDITLAHGCWWVGGLLRVLAPRHPTGEAHHRCALLRVLRRPRSGRGAPRPSDR